MMRFLEVVVIGIYTMGELGFSFLLDSVEFLGLSVSEGKKE